MAAGAEARGGALRFRGLRPTLAAVLCAQSLGLEGAAAGTKYNWQLVYKTTSLVDSGTEQGLGKDAVDDAWHSCDEHVSGIRYDINEKPYAYYRRNHESKDDKKFSAWELISECWKSKQDTDAPNMLTTDFDLYSNEADMTARGNKWTYCNYDDCGGNHHVGFPRDCGPTGNVPYRWHMFKDGLHNGQANVAFYVTKCNGWAPPLIDLEPGGTSGWTFSLLVLSASAAYFVGGSAYNRRLHGSKRPWKEELPHKHKWLHLYALVRDGVEFARRRGRTEGSSRAKGDAGADREEPLMSSDSSRVSPSKSSKERKEKKKEKEKEKREKKEKRKTKDASRTHREARDSGTSKDGASSAGDVGTNGDGTRQLSEHVDTAVHSSQARIVRVDLS